MAYLDKPRNAAAQQNILRPHGKARRIKPSVTIQRCNPHDADGAPQELGQGRQRPRVPERQRMNRTVFALSLGFGGLILATEIAHAAPTCGPRAVVVAQLADRYGETRRGMGLAGNAAIVEVYVSDTATWTVTATLPDGRTCLIASGTGWEALNEALPARGDPA